MAVLTRSAETINTFAAFYKSARPRAAKAGGYAFGRGFKRALAVVWPGDVPWIKLQSQPGGEF